MPASRIASMVLVLLGALAAVVTAADVSVAVTGGAYDDYDHNYVVGILRPGSSTTTCTGVWITTASGRRVVLTDAHCVASAAGSTTYVSFGPRYWPGKYLYSGRSYRDPDYDPQTSRSDLAVIVLAQPPRWNAAQFAAIGGSLGHPWLATVGFGDSHRGTRWHAKERVTSHTAVWLYLRYGTGNSCAGDSGGPDVIPGTDQIAALTDQGSCSQDQDTRVDTAAVQHFVDQAGR